MNNYQLYRTNLLLGGQMKWDLIVNNHNNTLYVSDFHLSPISNNIPYTYKIDDYLIKNDHKDNVKAYYNKNKGHFYNEGLDSQYTHNWPILGEDNTINYSKTFDAGCRRTKCFNRYKKQFELFCPLWLEHIYDDIQFTIRIKDINSNTVLASNCLRLSVSGVDAYHDKFMAYFNKYIDEAGLLSGSDDVININFDNSTATINGFNVSTGMFSTLHCNKLVANVIARERSLIETDNMLISEMSRNSMICKQLFNFNIHFDLEDILSGSIANILYGEAIHIEVDVKIGDTLLEKRDFYTEYSYIPKQLASKTDYTGSINVLDYLHDYECVELIDKNKFCQSICHWSLCDNSSYIFNVYDGFSGMLIEKEGDDYILYENTHNYGITPNMTVKSYDKNQNTNGWINSYSVKLWKDFYKYIKNTNKYKTDGSFIGDGTYINNIKYNYIPSFNADGLTGGIYVLSIVVPYSLLNTIVDNLATKVYELYNHTVYGICKEDLLILVSANPDYLSFGYFYNDILCQFDFDNAGEDTIFEWLKELKQMMKSAVTPSLVPFNESMQYITTKGPAQECTEIEYLKTKEFNYVLRYDGKIKPAFISNLSTLYYKDTLSNESLINSNYSKYSTTGLEPLYPSIGYCAIKPITTCTCDTIYNTNEYEYSWFNNSRCLILADTITFTYVNTKENGYETLDDIITNYILEFYSITDASLVTYIKSLYNISNNWEYFSDTNIDDYVYTITMTLK